MRYRKLDPVTGDRVFGHSSNDFFQDQPEAVAQAVQTRLGLFLGEWFLDETDGTDWYGKVLGTGTQLSYDAQVRGRILDTPGVLGISDYASQVDPDTRGLSIQATIDTVYGQAELTAALPVAAPSSTPYQQPVQLVAADGTPLVGADGDYLFDPKRPLP